jgi:hypothetical protein
MRNSPLVPRAGLALVSGALLAALAVSGCGTQSGVAAGDTSTTSPNPTTSATGAARSPSASPSATHAKSRASAGPPVGGPVPGGFAATSVTFVSQDEGFVLGTAPCAHKPCTSVVRTYNRGASWRGVPAPVVPLGQPGGASPAVWGIRFATPSVGFIFGSGLWETTDGGGHWAKIASPPGDIMSLAIIDGQIVALTQSCSGQSGCAATGTLLRRALGGGGWEVSATVTNPGTITTQAKVAAVLDGTSVLVTGDGGVSVATHATPCTTQGVSMASQVAVTAPDSLALLCSGQGAMGSVGKTVYVSGDLGAHWTKAGAPPMGGDPQFVGGGTNGRLVVAAASGASELYYSGNGGQGWGTAYQQGDGGQGFNDLGFTTTSDGVVVHGPAITDGDAEGRPGQLLLTSDGGGSWKAVTW